MDGNMIHMIASRSNGLSRIGEKSTFIRLHAYGRNQDGKNQNDMNVRVAAVFATSRMERTGKSGISFARIVEER